MWADAESTISAPGRHTIRGLLRSARDDSLILQNAPEETMDFKGKVALITGAGNGIGRASALGFAGGGAKVVVVDRDTAGGEGTAGIIRQQGGDALFVAADVTKSADVQAYVKAALDAYGTIDCFHNNAGIEGSVATTAEYDEAMFDAVMSVNVKGVFLGMRHILPVMLKQKRGAIVNTASVAGLVASPGMPAYVASKHAVIGLTKTAAGEVARSGVRVNAVCPGPIDTRMIHSLESMLNPTDPGSVGDRYQSNIPIGRYGTPEEVANLVLFLCSDLAGNITGAQYVVDGGRTATGGAVTNNLVR
jgi:NAD(P)-dependent dehydrogenase (short-subunit alcohol dehydrogenase family)